MTTSRSRVYPGSEAGEHLCDWLNSRGATKRVLSLFCGLRDALQFGRSFVLWANKPQLKAGDRQRMIVVEGETPENPLGYHVVEKRITEQDVEKHRGEYGPREWRALWTKIERLLRKFSFAPELDDSLEVGPARRMSFQWRSSNGREGMAVLWILELLNIGRLSRVRRCENCSKWFFSAVKEEGKFCTIKCQRTAYKSKDEPREQHREYMRAWRDRKRR